MSSSTPSHKILDALVAKIQFDDNFMIVSHNSLAKILVGEKKYLYEIFCLKNENKLSFSEIEIWKNAPEQELNLCVLGKNHGKIRGYFSQENNFNTLYFTTHIEEDLYENYFNKYKQILDQSSLFLIFNTNFDITYANEKFSEISFFDLSELLGTNYFNLIAFENHQEKMKQDFLDTISQKNIWRGVLKYQSRNKNFFWTLTTILPILDLDGEVKEYFCIQADITDIEIAKTQLKKSLDKLRELDHKKDDFLNIASHELRTPMTVIKGYLSMVLDGDLGNVDEEAKFYLDKVYSSVEGLLALINDMLDISKMESGNFDLIKERFDFKPFLKEIIYDMRAAAIGKNIVIKKDIQFEVLPFLGDKLRLRQIFINIIGNAIKFTPSGGNIFVSAYVIKNKLYVSIKDNGIGIPKQEIKKIFDKFSQAHHSLNREISGTGLGLAIVDGLIKKMKGELLVESQVGEGSEFIIIFPIK